MPGDSMYLPIVSFQLEMGFKCRTLVQKFGKNEEWEGYSLIAKCANLY